MKKIILSILLSFMIVSFMVNVRAQMDNDIYDANNVDNSINDTNSMDVNETNSIIDNSVNDTIFNSTDNSINGTNNITMSGKNAMKSKIAIKIYRKPIKSQTSQTFEIIFFLLIITVIIYMLRRKDI